ncbi:gamma-tubulin complex component 2-like isoform X2 [Diorhabda sublineata]|uniref:gamma-tubulin complex component 2-like isoform X2 n=1 Tax=Diorhabda sublineata TaxID=1163346 RepID=UPI0024E0BFEB|nr:gamma-tubulin complex component 2-like isoform X2 [Diorhabda sublineata]
MSEFKLQHIVADLLNTLGGKVNPNKLVEYLQESQTVDSGGCIVIAQNHLARLSQDIPDSSAFLAKYNDLKDKNVDSLDAFVQLLDHISQDISLKEFLIKSNRPSLSATTELTKDNLPQIKNRLKKAVTKKSTKDDSLKSILNTTPTVPLASTPTVVSWVQRRPNMTWDFSPTISHQSVPTVPAVSQENILIEDILNILIGLPGGYIEPEELKDLYGPRTFKINDNVPLSLRELIKQILPLASHYSIIQRFTEEKMRFEFGQVNNALAEAMQNIIKEHMLFTIQLESEFRSSNLSIQKLWFYVQRNMQSLGIAANIASTISKSDAKGGKVLSLLHDHVVGSIGDERAQLLCLKLMEAACYPYMKMLGMWIYRGIISDPINEFLIEDNEVVQREDMPVDYSADYWEKKYAVRRERIPKFLEPVADIILKAGKYLNVIRQCGKPVKNKVLPIQYKIEEKHYIEAIEKAYIFASQTLLDLVIKEKDLLGRLKSVKHYFLLDQGDFIVTFLSLCEKELGKYSVDVHQSCIESLMDLALRLSSAIDDPYKDDLRTELLPYDLQFQMFKILSIQTNSEQVYWSVAEQEKLLMIQSFSFSYEVHWPLSLILNRKSLACYQMIFRHLFYCKYIERMICQVWKSNKVAKKFPFDDAQHYRAAFALRQRMLHCIQNLEYHMMVEVIEPHWCTFLNKIAKVQNVDEILSCHWDFLNSCLKDCMLTIPPILSTIMKLLSICEEFCEFVQNELVFQGNCEPTEPTLSFKEKIAIFDVSFSGALIRLLDQINELNRDTSEHERLFNLLYRLDFNSFYSGQLKKIGLERFVKDSSG